jgi:hypothetical protein
MAIAWNLTGLGELLLTVFTSPAINFILVFWYFLPLLLSIVTHPAKSIKSSF